MATVKPSLSTRQCITWETKLSAQHCSRESEAFECMSGVWYFILRLTSEYETYSCNYNGYYDIFIIGPSNVKEIYPFSVSVHLESPNNNRALFRQKNTISSPGQSLWRVNLKQLREEVSESSKYEVTFVCLFEKPCMCSTLHTKQTESKSVQASFDIPLMWKKLQDTSLLIDSSSSTYLDLPYALENLSKDLGDILENRASSDVKLKNGERTIPAHRTVLAARSEVFAAMFQHEMAESSSGIIEIKDVDPTVLDVFLKFMYCGKVADNLPEDTISNLYTIGDKYAVYSLKRICSNLMIKNVNEDNILKFLTLADDHSDIEFKDALTSFITKDDTFLRNKTWFIFAKEKPFLANEVYENFFSK